MNYRTGMWYKKTKNRLSHWK